MPRITFKAILRWRWFGGGFDFRDVHSMCVHAHGLWMALSRDLPPISCVRFA